MKTMINGMLSRVGYRVTKSSRRLHLEDAARHLSEMGVKPRTVIDVGVAWGTEELYRQFPDAELLLVEPNQQWRKTIDNILADRSGQAVYCAAGSEDGSITLHVWDKHPGSSTIMEANAGTSDFGQHVTVPIKRLDAVVDEVSFAGPYVLKIDVQGAELDTLKGASGILDDCVAVIVEVSFFGNGNVPEIGEVVAYMLNVDFVLYDIVGMSYRPSDHAAGQVDLVFVPRNGELRASHAWD